MRKRYFVISDIEMGRGDVMDDFSDDATLVEFVEGLPKDEGVKTFLVLNGDIFDFLKMDYHGEYPRYITEDISLWKLDLIYKTHQRVFDALSKFLSHKNSFLYFVIGNHDFDVVWPKIQARLCHVLEQRERVGFGFVFQDGVIHMEHGHSLDPFFEHNAKKPIIHFQGKQILDMPIGCHIVFDYIAPFKRKFPKEDRLYPRSKAVEHYPEYGKGIKHMQWWSIWHVAFNRLIYFFDPTYRINAYGFFKHVLEFGFDFIDDSRFLASRLKKLPKAYPNMKLFVLGHMHNFAQAKHENKHFLVTDTWRNEYNFLLEGSPKKKKTYVEIHQENGIFQCAEVKFFEPTYSNQ